ncbi:unnamed protein product, partial [Amoebophrya sp. A25]
NRWSSNKPSKKRAFFLYVSVLHVQYAFRRIFGLPISKGKTNQDGTSSSSSVLVDEAWSRRPPASGSPTLSGDEQEAQKFSLNTYFGSKNEVLSILFAFDCLAEYYGKQASVEEHSVDKEQLYKLLLEAENQEMITIEEMKHDHPSTSRSRRSRSSVKQLRQADNDHNDKEHALLQDFYLCQIAHHGDGADEAAASQVDLSFACPVFEFEHHKMHKTDPRKMHFFVMAANGIPITTSLLEKELKLLGARATSGEVLKTLFQEEDDEVVVMAVPPDEGLFFLEEHDEVADVEEAEEQHAARSTVSVMDVPGDGGASVDPQQGVAVEEPEVP